ncbi:aldose 1-epimerase family protein [Algoriphagus aquimarinus]|uniref:aldose 1-epimerase family protein n=1 Tax=Algoriphagus aquimarinus TaxID=237018 RepID=UPI0030DAFFAE|tara:strand:+ start:8633 stop:9511 length:879 start_codon:yes stop_codon:yes gene_type:complete
MNYTLQSVDLTVEINPIGMEISSIKSKITGLEYIWQADPAIWNGQAPVLFPIVGGLKDGFTIIEGKKYEMPKHGFVRNSSKPKLIEKTDDSARFRLSWDEEYLAQYPFKFQLDMVFTLVGKTLSIEHQVTNLGSKTLPYFIGAHPAFNCPLHAGETYEEYSLTFPELETDATWLIEDSGLISDQTQSFLENSSSINLEKHLFDKDALIFKHLKSREVTLTHKDKGAILSVQFDDFDYLGIWAKSGAPFVCIEPWLGIGDSANSNNEFLEKEGLQKLEPQQSETKSYSITVIA